MEQKEPVIHEKANGADLFARNLAARANTFCRCRPPIPPRFPTGEDQDLVRACVAQQATELLEDALGPVTIEGPKPALDTAQRNSLSEYLEAEDVDVPDEGLCDQDRWMEAVAAAAMDSWSSGKVVNMPILRVDRRHPTVWSEIGFVSASTNPALTTSAEPAMHYHSLGSQVWVSASSHMSGIETVLAYGGTKEDVFEPDVCIAYNARSHGFEARKPSREACGGSEPRDVNAGEPLEIYTPLLITYVYSTDGGVDVYQPDRENLDFEGKEEEVLSLGFRPSGYRGAVVVLFEGFQPNYTRDFTIRYNPQRGCEGLERPPLAFSTPFVGLKQSAARATAGLDCRSHRDDCAACLQLTVPASSCAMSLGSSL